MRYEGKGKLADELDSNSASPASLFLYFCSSGQPETDWVYTEYTATGATCGNPTARFNRVAPPTWRASRLSEIESAINNSQRLLGLIETPKTKPVLQR